MLIAEVFVTSYGVLGIGGVIAFVIGSLFLVDSSQTNLEVNRSMIAGAAIAMSAIILGLGWIVLRERHRRPTTGREGMVGEVGEVREAIAPGAPGRVFVHGEHWRAASDQALGVGARARVIAVRGLRSRCAANRDAALCAKPWQIAAATPVKKTGRPMGPAIGVIIVIGVMILLSGLKVLNEYERAVVFRLGFMLGGMSSAPLTSWRVAACRLWSSQRSVPNPRLVADHGCEAAFEKPFPIDSLMRRVLSILIASRDADATQESIS